MPFLIEHGSSEIGVYISFTTLISVSFLSMSDDNNIIKLVPFIFILFSGLIVLFWWRKSLSRNYIDKIKAQEIQALKDTIDAKDGEIDELKRQNEELGKIIHRDNKLIPALEYTVRQYLLTAGDETDSGVRAEKAKALLAQVESAFRERAGIIASYEAGSRRLPSTGVPSVDSLLAYMLQRCLDQQIDFNLTLSGSVKYLVENIATEQDLNTLLADLIENAIIATKKSAYRNILVHIGIANDTYFIGVFDNGVPFAPETINDLGLKRTTTHTGEGGSGIGLMTAFDILRKYKASFVIEDIGNAMYTKSVSACFDQMGQFRVKSEQLSDKLLSREDLVLMNEIGA